MSDITDLYYASKGFIGYGSQLLVRQGAASPASWAAVAQVASIEFGDMTAGIINKTHLRSPGRAHEKISTIRDIGPFSITGTLDLTHGSMTNAGGDGFTDGGLIKLHRTQQETDMKVVLSDGSPGTEVPFRGVVSQLKLGTVGLDQLVSYSAQIQPLSDYTEALP